VKYEYESLKHSAKVWMYLYRQERIHAYLCRAINNTRLALSIREYRHDR
jgi:hypothetical protein